MLSAVGNTKVENWNAAKDKLQAHEVSRLLHSSNDKDNVKASMMFSNVVKKHDVIGKMNNAAS